MSLRRWLLVATAGVLWLSVSAGTCIAQVDLVANAKNTWFYGYYCQMGDRGFFGRYNVDASSTAPAFANVNGWMGNRPTDVGIIVSGSNAAVAGMGLEIDPSLGSDWVRFTGKYTINVYDANSTQGAYVSMSPGQLTAWALDVHTPVASFGYGKRAFPRGMGLQFASARTIELLFMQRSAPVPDLIGRMVCRGLLPKGALSWFNPDTWKRVNRKPDPEPADECSDSKAEAAAEPQEKSIDDPCGPTVNPPYAEATFGPAEVTVGFGIMPWERISELALGTNWNPKDVNQAQTQNFMGYLMYTSHDLEFGVGCLRLFGHEGPELIDNRAVPVAVPAGQLALLRYYIPTKETDSLEGWLYLKYSNGRFMILTELDWYNRTVKYRGSTYAQIYDAKSNTLVPVFYTDGSGRSRLAPRYIESWRYAAEIGTFMGASSVRVLYSFLPGPDMRHGILVDRQPFINDEQRAAYGVFEPYSPLLSYFFGGGVASHGDINAASVFALKVDHALAANLFLSCSLSKAIRSSDGFGWGHIRPNVATFGDVEYGNYPNPAIAGGQPTFDPALPTIPNRDLGWEFTAGATWQLVDGWTFDTRFAYWKPGKWFSYACIDKSVANWDLPSANNNWGVNPNRVIDAIAGFEIRFAAKY